jgi:deoxyribodipyrimidine photo-lyase
MTTTNNEKKEKSLFIFRRDLRLEDNTGLIAALENSNEVICAFIFDTRQANPEKNKYFSENAFQFMIESLKELNEELKSKNSKLYIFEGIASEVINELIIREKIDSIYANKDYTPFSMKRDAEINQVCKKHNIKFELFDDALLHPSEKTLKSDGKAYNVFTPFYKNAMNIEVSIPKKNNHKNYYSKNINGTVSFPKHNINSKIFVNGGRKNALKILSGINKFENYQNERDYPKLQATTGLSAHNKFGTLSIREIYYAMAKELGQEHMLVRQLYWRDFFTIIAFYNPQVFGHAFNSKYDKIEWINDEKNKNFIAWKNGMTGFPIVDAGMRELNTTGYMHNRVRMIVASFLTKDLHIDWRLGEKYFASKLVDYDPAVNNGSWQWSASTGCDAQPYFRIFNPWRQQERFDETSEYIKRWVPELKELNSKQINNLEDEKIYDSVKNKIGKYPKPIVEHSVESKIAIDMFRKY